MADEINPYNAAARPATMSESMLDPSPTTADFMLQLDDVVEMSLHAPANRRQRRKVILVCLVGSLGGLLLVLNREVRFGGIIIMAALWASLASILSPLWRWRIKRLCAQIHAGDLPWQQTVNLSSAGLKTTTPRVEALYRWHAIQQIDVTPTRALFYVNGAQAVIVPARAFRSESQFHGFVTLAREFWTAGNGRLK
jgi:hypothetical protein